MIVDASSQQITAITSDIKLNHQVQLNQSNKNPKVSISHRVASDELFERLTILLGWRLKGWKYVTIISDAMLQINVSVCEREKVVERSKDGTLTFSPVLWIVSVRERKPWLKKICWVNQGEARRLLQKMVSAAENNPYQIIACTCFGITIH